MLARLAGIRLWYPPPLNSTATHHRPKLDVPVPPSSESPYLSVSSSRLNNRYRQYTRRLVVDLSFASLLATRQEEMVRAEALDHRPGLWDAAFVEGQPAFNPDASLADEDEALSTSEEPDDPTPSPTSSRRSSMSDRAPDLLPTASPPSTTDRPLDSAAQGRLAAKTRKNRKRRNARWRRYNEEKESGKATEAAYGRDSKRRRVQKKVHQTAIELEAPSLPHSKQGYIGTSGRRVPATKPTTTTSSDEDPRDAKLRELLDQRGYQLIESKDCPDIIVDKEATIPGFKPGVLGSREAWDGTVRGISRAVVELNKVIFGDKPPAKAKSQKAGVARGDFKSAHFGFSFGGGQEVSLPPSTQSLGTDVPSCRRQPRSSRPLRLGLVGTTSKPTLM